MIYDSTADNQWPVVWSVLEGVTLLHRTVTLLHCYTVTVLQWYIVTFLKCNSVMGLQGYKEIVFTAIVTAITVGETTTQSQLLSGEQ